MLQDAQFVVFVHVHAHYFDFALYRSSLAITEASAWNYALELQNKEYNLFLIEENQCETSWSLIENALSNHVGGIRVEKSWPDTITDPKSTRN